MENINANSTDVTVYQWRFFLALLLLMGTLPHADARAQTGSTSPLATAQASATVKRAAESDPDASWRSQRAVLEHAFGEELVEIASWCRESGIPQQVEQTYKLKIPRDPNRQYIFLPSEKTMPEAPEGILGQWLEKVNAAKRKHADRILELAEQAAKAELGSIAKQPME